MNNINNTMRVYHRYLGFFLAGIMAVYAVSGIVMIFRETEFLKSEVITEKILPKDFKTEELGKEVRIRNFKIEKEENGIVYFKDGSYDRNSGTLKFTKKELPYILSKMEKMHKATTNEPLFFLNILVYHCCFLWYLPFGCLCLRPPFSKRAYILPLVA